MSSQTRVNPSANYRVQDLVLLVGENPLPNAVAARLLLGPGHRAWLVHSAGTRDQAGYLAAHLKQRGFDVPIPFTEIDEASPASVLQGTLRALNKAKGQAVGVNYTGGTKVMATHAYRAAELWAYEQKRSVCLSYLDARRQRMVFTLSGDVEDAGSIDLSDQPVSVSLEEVRGLHGLARRTSGEPDPLLPQAAATIATSISSIGAAAWKAWKEAVKEGRRPPSSLVDIENAIRSEARLPTGIPIGVPGLAHSTGRRPSDVKDWIDGKWLESHVYALLLALKAKCVLTDCALGYETVAPHFEVDVLAMRHHQLLAVSCGTKIAAQDNPDKQKDARKAQRDECQAKLFEVRTRARQFGGDEAASALVSLLEGDDLTMIQNRVRDDRMDVLGLPDLRDLGGKLMDWIQRQVVT